MFNISDATLKSLRKRYPAGARVELVRMDDLYNTKLVPGCKGTVKSVDDAGTIHVAWDCGSSLGVVYGEDLCRVLDYVTVECYGERKVWDSRTEAIAFFEEGMLACEGSEADRYKRIWAQLREGLNFCSDAEDDE